MSDSLVLDHPQAAEAASTRRESLPRWWRWAWGTAASDLTGPFAVQAELRERQRS